MPHMVIFRSPEGKPGYHQSETLDEAVRFVEHLRNSEGATETRIFRMQEVPIEVRTYFRVEVASPVAETEPPRGADDHEKHGPVLDDPIVVEPLGSNGSAPRFGRFNRA